MREVDGSGDNRKRPAGPSSSNRPQKKSKTLSAIATRALAVLESDDGSSSEDDRDVGDFQHQEHQERDFLSVSRRTGRPALEPAIDLDDDVVAADGESSTTKTHNAIDEAKEAECTGNSKEENKGSSQYFSCKSHHEENRGSSPSDGVGNIDDTIESHQNGQPPSAKTNAPRINETSNNDVGTITDSDVAVREVDEEPGDDSPATDEDVVCPHAHTSEYKDILSYFLSTPFDDKAMMTLHKLKEDPKTIGRKKQTNIKDKFEFQRWVSSHKDYVPIIPQKEFIKGKEEKHSATTHQRESLENTIYCDTSPVSSAAINAEVTSFLVQEGQNLVNSSHNLQITSDKQQTLFRYPPAPPNHLPMTQQPSAQQSPTQQLISRQTQQVQQPNYYGFTSQQHSYYQTPMLNSYNPCAQMHRGYQDTNAWQYSEPYAAPAAAFAPVHSTTNAYNNPAISSPATAVLPTQDSTAPMQHATAATQPRTNVPQANPKVVIANAEIKLTNSNRTDVSKLPVAFGFFLVDGGASKSLAQKATQKWVTEGESAAKSESHKQGAPRWDSGSKHGDNDTPEGSSANESPNETIGYTRRNATPPEQQSAGPEFPFGWTTKIFERITRRKDSTYNHYYSPVIKAKFRSRKSAHIFIEILKEPGIHHDEEKAFNVFKRRGHKL